MSLHFLTRLNASMWVLFGWFLAVFTADVNGLLGTQYPGFTPVVGIVMMVFALWLWRSVKRDEPRASDVKVAVIGNYVWSLLVFALITSSQVVVAPDGIRYAIISALLTAAMGALLFRHYKLLLGKY